MKNIILIDRLDITPKFIYKVKEIPEEGTCIINNIVYEFLFNYFYDVYVCKRISIFERIKWRYLEWKMNI